MNTHHISSIVSSSLARSDVIKGVFPRDQFVEQKISYPSSYVLNTDNSDQPGSHWVGVHFSKEQKCEYFDSFGIEPLFSDIKNKLLAIDSAFVYNDCSLQSFNTNVCGIYCVIYTVMKCKGYSSQQIIDVILLTGNDDERDHALKFL